jgi:hypothetical protein
MKNWDRIVSQVTSGRWILTVIGGICFFMVCYVDCKVAAAGKTPVPFSVEAIVSIMTMVFANYFNQKKESDTSDTSADSKGTPPPVQPPIQQPPVQPPAQP